MKNIGGNAVIIKEININLVKELLKNKGQATKQEIAKESGLSFVTVGSALQHLLQKMRFLKQSWFNPMEEGLHSNIVIIMILLMV